MRLTIDQILGGTVAQVMTPDGLVLAAHMACRPFAMKRRNDGTVIEVDVRLPRTLAVMYLDWRGQWKLPPLSGIASAPLLQDDGTIHSAAGYDTVSGMWRENVPELSALIPDSPTAEEAAAALSLIRETFKTFCFADAVIVDAPTLGVAVVDTSLPPGKDESAFLIGLLTAVCRPSLHLAPGLLLRAAPMSGAGAGKGLLARCISLIAFGREPHAVTGGGNIEELEKRIAAELIEGSPTLFLDIVRIGNGIELRLILWRQHRFRITPKIGAGHRYDMTPVTGDEVTEMQSKLIVWIDRDVMELVHRDQPIVEGFDPEFVYGEAKSSVRADQHLVLAVEERLDRIDLAAIGAGGVTQVPSRRHVPVRPEAELRKRLVVEARADRLLRHDNDRLFNPLIMELVESDEHERTTLARRWRRLDEEVLLAPLLVGAFLHRPHTESVGFGRTASAGVGNRDGGNCFLILGHALASTLRLLGAPGDVVI